MDALTYLIFAVVGVIVSFDVTALTLSQIPNFTRKNQSIFTWALKNAFWHSALLLAYIIVISGFFNFSLGIVDFLEWFFIFISEYWPLLIGFKYYAIALLDLLREHTGLILGVVTLVIVWNIYSEKIVSKPELGSRDDLPILAKTLYDVVEIFYSLFKRKVSPNEISDSLNSQASAALVAIDMLALAALLKSMGYLATTQQKITIVLMVFFIVLFFAWAAGRKGAKFYSDYTASIDSTNINQRIANYWILITLRIIEPFLIFYFVLELLAFLIFQEKIHSLGFFFGAMLLVWGLIHQHTLTKIVMSTLSTNSEQMPAPSIGLRKFKDIFNDVLSLLKVLIKYFVYFIVSLFLLIVFTYFTYHNPAELISLDTLISQVMSFTSGILLIFFILPPKWCPINLIINIMLFFFPFIKWRPPNLCDRIEFSFVFILEKIHKNRHTFLFIMAALIIAATFPIFENLIGEALVWENILNTYSPKKIGLKPNHFHVVQAEIWLIYFFILGFVLEIFEKKFHVENKEFLIENDMPTIIGICCVKAIMGISIIYFSYAAYFQEFIRISYENSN